MAFSGWRLAVGGLAVGAVCGRSAFGGLRAVFGQFAGGLWAVCGQLAGGLRLAVCERFAIGLQAVSGRFAVGGLRLRFGN